jgi:hypothetical protein
VSLSDLHLSHTHFPLSATWDLTLPHLLWNQRPHELHWVPDFRFVAPTAQNMQNFLSLHTRSRTFLHSTNYQQHN